jgi:DNA repair protein RadA/Sms
MILAVLEARCGISFSGKDVYLNVAGGLRVSEPAADLAVVAALISAQNNEPMPSDSVVFGEIGLSGEVRPVGQADLRLKEAQKLGFSRAFTPGWDRKKNPRVDDGMQSSEIEHIDDLIDLLPTNENASGKQAGAA